MPTLLEGKFLDFNQEHPEIYRTMVAKAILWRRRRGPGSVLGVKMLIETTRWSLGINSIVDVPKIDNNFSAFYARLMMDNEPELVGAFNLRRQREQASFGPVNEVLPLNEHVV